MMLTKTPSNGIPQSAPKRKLEEKCKEIKNPKQRRVEKVKSHIRQSPRRSAKDSKSDSGECVDILTCGVCTETFKSRTKFCVHMQKEHSLEVHYQCQACLKTFPDQRLLQNHKCQVIPVADDKLNKVQHTCSLCQLVFSSLYNINLHQWSSHGAKAFRCLRCSQLLGSVANLADHVHDHSRRPKESSSNRTSLSARHGRQKLLFSKQKKKMAKNLESAKTFQCDFCNQSFPNLSLTMEHRRGLHKEAKLTCNCCQHTFPDSTHLGQHLARSSEDQMSQDTEMTDTAVSTSSSTPKEEANTIKAIPVADFPSSDTDVIPASSSATEGSTTVDVCDFTTDQDPNTPCKKDDKAEMPEEVPKVPSPVKPEPEPPQLETLPLVNESQYSNTEKQCSACNSTFTPKNTSSEEVICSKCETVKKPDTSQDDSNPEAPPAPVVEPPSDEPQNVDEKEPANDVPAKEDAPAVVEAEGPADPKSDEEEDGSEDPSESKDSKKNYVCDVCEQSFGSVTWVMRHRKKHEEAQLKCNICQIKFLQSSDLGHHLAECRQEMTASLYTAASSSNNDAYTPTVPLPVEKTNVKSFVCDFCSLSFASVSWVMRHRKRHVDDLGTYWCRVCFETFDKSADFGRHLADCVGVRKTPAQTSQVATNKNETSTKPPTEKGKDTDQPDSGEPKPRFKCDFCTQDFASVRWVIRHRQQHTDDCICRFCYLSFDRTVELGRHFAAGCAVVTEESKPNATKPDAKPKTSKPYNPEKESSQNDLPSETSENKDDGVVFPCDFCLQSFASGRWVIRHRKQHEGGENLTCQRCQAIFNRSVDLSKHLSVCPKTQDISATISQPSAMTAEEAEEDGNGRSFQCDICGQNYASARWVMRHRRSHNTPELPFVCHNCNCSFNKSVEISQHLRLCHNPSALSNSVDQISKTGLDSTTEIPSAPTEANKQISDQPLAESSENSFSKSADLDTSNIQPIKSNNDCPLPVCVKKENFPVTSTPINLSLRPDSVVEKTEIPKEPIKEPPPSPIDCSKYNFDCLEKTSPVDLVQRKKIITIPKKENEERPVETPPEKIQYLNNLESKSLSPKIPENQHQVCTEIKSPGTGNKFSCDYCSDKFPDVITLLSHRQQHSVSSNCNRCGKKFTKCIEVCQHLERHCHANSQAGLSASQMVPKQYYCDFCFKTYGGSNWIMRHRRKHTDEKNYSCRVCPFSSKVAGSMARHLASCRLIKASLKNTGFQPKKTVANSFMFASSTVSCDICSSSFLSMPELLQHRKYHTSEEVNRCPHCNMALIPPNQMANHLASCPAKLNNQTFLPTNTNRNGIINHEDLKMKYLPKEQGRGVDTEKVFTCDFCGQGFATALMVMQHRRFHTKDLAHVCRNCGKLFAITEMGNHLSTCKQRSNTNQALPSTESRAMADGEAGVLDLKKKYTCDFCSKTFDTSNLILRHRLTHTSNVPYKCQRCGQIFDLARAMADHLTSCHLASTGHGSKLLMPNYDKMTYLCDRCGGHFPRTEVTRATKDLTYRCHYCLKQNPLLRIMDQKIDGTCAYCVAGFDSPASLQDHLKNCSATKHRTDFYSNQKIGASRLEEPGRSLSTMTPAHSKIAEPCYSEPQDLSINSYRTYIHSSANRLVATPQHKHFTLENHPQNSLGGSSLIETPKTHQEKIYISQGPYERTSSHEKMSCLVPLTDFDKHDSVWDGSGKHFEKRPVSGVPTDLRVEVNGLKDLEKQKATPKEKDLGEQKTEINGKDYERNESIQSEHPSSNTSSKNAKEKFTQSLNLISRNSMFPCDFCEAAFATESLLLAHRLTHVTETNLWCRLCSRAFNNSSDFVCHLTCCKIQHKNSGNLWQFPSPNKKDSYRCDFCEKSFTQKHAVMRHRREHEEQENMIFRCHRCQCVFYKSTVFVSHLSICRSRKSSMLPNRSRTTYGYNGSWRRLVSTNRVKTQKLYYCDFCHKKFGGSNWIMRHRRTHEDGCIYTCQLCGLAFEQAGLMADHLSQCYSHGRETPNQSKSSESESAASTPSRDFPKVTDRNKQLPSSPHQCKRCSFLFNTKEALECHMPSCNKCLESKKPEPVMNDRQQRPELKSGFEKLLSTRPASESVSSSSKQTEYPCDFCGKCFLGVSWIMRHRHTHVADPSDLKCQHCRQDFDNTSLFVSHLNSCLKPADYNAVQKAFLSKSSSAVHKQEPESGSASSEIEDNTPVSFTFECCSQTFSQVADLTAHIKTHSRRPSS